MKNMTAPTVDTPTVPPAADAAGKNAEPATNATPDKTEVGVPTAKLLEDVSAALLLARRDISVLESQLAARREVEAARAALNGIADHGWCYDGRVTFTINCVGMGDAKRLEALLTAALAATPEEK